MPIPVRSLRGIRTMSGKVDQKSTPYRAYMQITCLEMEKARRNSVRESAVRHIAEIDIRLREIEEEKAALLRALSEPGTNPTAPRNRLPQAAVPRSRVQFKVRY
jgi:hypothetical protein